MILIKGFGFRCFAPVLGCLFPRTGFEHPCHFSHGVLGSSLGIVPSSIMTEDGLGLPPKPSRGSFPGCVCFSPPGSLVMAMLSRGLQCWGVGRELALNCQLGVGGSQVCTPRVLLSRAPTLGILLASDVNSVSPEKRGPEGTAGLPVDNFLVCSKGEGEEDFGLVPSAEL